LLEWILRKLLKAGRLPWRASPPREGGTYIKFPAGSGDMINGEVAEGMSAFFIQWQDNICRGGDYIL